ncbi:hypothetical protein NHU_04136 [Rhodovulum sulfidophilum]|uniref:Uncharacterized protein n=1 Tax=Rhodovulum sulfidophilum TaxID=35806 RepID=A0A0D6B813_RHOSU|nr:hypothetical protein NHU_04136 [Rhodovulum sulfidophilum]
MAVTYTPGHAAASPYPMTHARILWDKAAGSVSATSEAEGFEAGLADTVETNSWWKPEAVPASWRIEYGESRLIDAIGLAAHDLGTVGSHARIEYKSPNAHGNLLLYSQEIQLWPVLLRAELVPTLAPDGSMDARWLVEEEVDGAHLTGTDFQAVAGRMYTFSIYVKPNANGRRLRMSMEGAAYAVQAIANVGGDGAIASSNGAAATSSVAVGDTGWFRVSMSAAAQATGFANIRLLIRGPNDELAHPGTGQAVGLFGGQAEWRLGPSPYVRSASSPAASNWWAVSDDWLLPSDDSAILYLFDPVETDGIRVSVSEPARIGVVYTGKALEMPRMGYTDLGMIDLGRTAVLASYISEGGQLMGRFIQRAGLSGAFEWQNLPEDWYRQTFDPFARAARTEPFFIAARPEGYPTDCAYAWVDDPIMPARQGMRNFVSVGFTATGHADAAA